MRCLNEEKFSKRLSSTLLEGDPCSPCKRLKVSFLIALRLLLFEVNSEYTVSRLLR